MTPLERIQTLAATAAGPSHVPPTPPGYGESSTMLAGDFGGGRSAISDSQSTIGNNSRSLRRNRFSFNGRKPSFSWLSSTSSINSTAPVKGIHLLAFETLLMPRRQMKATRVYNELFRSSERNSMRKRHFRPTGSLGHVCFH